MRHPITLCEEPFDADFSVRMRGGTPKIFDLQLIDAGGVVYSPPPWLEEIIIAHLLAYCDLEETE